MSLDEEPGYGDPGYKAWLENFWHKKTLQQNALCARIELPFYSGHRMKWYGGKPPLKKVWPVEKPLFTKGFFIGIALGLAVALLWMIASVLMFSKL